MWGPCTRDICHNYWMSMRHFFLLTHILFPPPKKLGPESCLCTQNGRWGRRSQIGQEGEGQTRIGATNNFWVVVPHRGGQAEGLKKILGPKSVLLAKTYSGVLYCTVHTVVIIRFHHKVEVYSYLLFILPIQFGQTQGHLGMFLPRILLQWYVC